MLRLTEKPPASIRGVRHRSDSGSRSEGTTETTAHRPSHLVPDQSGTTKGGSGRIHYSSLRAQAKDGAETRGPGTVRSAVVSLRRRSPGGLV
jgi:hypothetical protein